MIGSEARRDSSIREHASPNLAWPIAGIYSSLAILSTAVAAIHFAVMGAHFREFALFGMFFSIVAWVQALWALGVVGAPTRSLLLAGSLFNALVALVWLISRTTGLPLGPAPGVAEPVSFLDGLSTAIELVIATLAGGLVLKGIRVSASSRAPRVRSVGGLLLALVLLSTIAVATAGGEAGDHGHAPRNGVHSDMSEKHERRAANARERSGAASDTGRSG